MCVVFVTMVTTHSYNIFSTQNNLSSNMGKKILVLDNVKEKKIFH